nr:MAG TPA_asm: hypothetical protein [Caudoviricetes sp.]
MRMFLDDDCYGIHSPTQLNENKPLINFFD